MHAAGRGWHARANTWCAAVCSYDYLALTDNVGIHSSFADDGSDRLVLLGSGRAKGSGWAARHRGVGRESAWEWTEKNTEELDRFAQQNRTEQI